MELRNRVRGIAHDFDVAKITVVGVPDRPGIAAAIFQPLAVSGISVDTIVQNASINNITDLTFTISRSQLQKAMAITENVAKQIGAARCASDPKLGKVSIIGTGMRNAPGYITIYVLKCLVQLIGHHLQLEKEFLLSMV